MSEIRAATAPRPTVSLVTVADWLGVGKHLLQVWLLSNEQAANVHVHKNTKAAP